MSALPRDGFALALFAAIAHELMQPIEARCTDASSHNSPAATSGEPRGGPRTGSIWMLAMD